MKGSSSLLVLVHSVKTLIQIQLLRRIADGHLAAHLDELRRVDAVHLGEGFHVAQAGLPPIRGNLGFILQSLDHQPGSRPPFNQDMTIALGYSHIP